MQRFDRPELARPQRQALQGHLCRQRGANAVGRKRIPAWMAYHEISVEERGNIFLVKTETILPNEVSRANLLAAIRAIVPPSEDFLLVIDVLRGTMTGSESDDEAANAWTRAAEILITESRMHFDSDP
jgi:hypothetical protein